MLQNIEDPDQLALQKPADQNLQCLQMSINPALAS